MQKSAKAKFTINKFDGVRRLGVVVNTYTTNPFPIPDITPTQSIKSPITAYHPVFNGAN